MNSNVIVLSNMNLNDFTHSRIIANDNFQVNAKHQTRIANQRLKTRKTLLIGKERAFANARNMWITHTKIADHRLRIQLQRRKSRAIFNKSKDSAFAFARNMWISHTKFAIHRFRIQQTRYKRKFIYNKSRFAYLPSIRLLFT